MTQRDETSQHSAGEAAALIARRYRQLGELGGGGMAVVHQVLDTVNGRRVALKRPRSHGSAEHQQRMAELFAREFHTLIQLAHPRIVEVYDYGVDEHGPYYTMELLDGGDLQTLMPVDYRRACAIGSDVCSALSLLHSRRIVHRDVSPRNIRCTSDGLAKLIDFGAMTHMGPNKELVGTPVYCAPEVLNLQALDARTDLYALGASLYYALTGHHPYPVRDFASLPNAWRFGVPQPSELSPEIPEALDALIMELLQLSPDARPSNAAEVMARLSAIAGVTTGEQLLVAQAYLATPAFVGRENELSRVKARTARALRKHGTALLIEGAPGAGRSRFLEASLLESKLLGVTVVRADADDGETDYGVVRRWLSQLQQLQPQLMLELTEPVLPVLARVAPELAAGRDVSVAAADVATLRPQLQAAIRQVFLSVADRMPLVLAVDDLHAIDEPSTAAISLLAQQAREVALVIVATSVSGALAHAASAFKLYAESARRVPIKNLTLEEAQRLLASVFGASHALTRLTPRLHALAAGSPRDLMRLAQHLVDTGSARYHAGSWSLSTELAGSELPGSVAQLLSSRLQALSDSARDLARTLALCPEKSFTLEECAQLSERDQTGAVLADMEQLTKADVLRAVADRVALADRAWVPLLNAGLDEAHERTLHLRLARVFEARPEEGFRYAQELLRAGESERALDMFVSHAATSRALTDRSPEAFHQLLLSLPADWFETYEEVIQKLRQLQRPRCDDFAVLTRIASMAAVGGAGQAPITLLEQQLKRACGLTDWEQADPTLDPATRLRVSFEQAQARYLSTPEHERFADPMTAVRELATAVRMRMYLSALGMDLKSALAGTSLKPLTALSPGLVIADLLVQGVHARLSGRLDRAREIYRGLLQRFATPASTGLDPTHLEYTRLIVLNGVAVIDAGSGLSSCLAAADQIERHPAMQCNAWLIRMVHHLWQGNSLEAERCRKQFDVTRIQNSAGQNYESVQLTWQLIAQVAMEDLTRIKQSLDEVAPLAKKFPAFHTVQSYGEAEYQRIRGDSRRAVEILTQVLSTCEAGSHQIWPQLAAAHINALDAAGRNAEAVERGRAYLADAERVELGPTASDWISHALCVAEAKTSEPNAARSAEALIERCLAAGATGLKLGLAYEARARIAIIAQDAGEQERYRGLCERAFAEASNPALAAKLQKLRREAQRRKLTKEAPLLDASQRGDAATLIRSRLRTCSDAAQRAQALLALLAQHSGSAEGHLYQLRNDGATWVASVGQRQPDDTLHAMVRAYIMAELHEDAQSTGSPELSVQTDWTALGETMFRPVLLSHYTQATCVVTGLAVLVVAPDRPFMYPGEMATQISRMMQEAGDATGMLIADG